MASTFAVTRNHLIFGLCLPLAVLLGYTLADVQDPASRIVILIALAVLSVPLLMKWYHPVLVLSWNSVVQFALLGSLNLWCVMAVLGLFIAILNRSINAQEEFLLEPSLTRPLLVLTAVVAITAMTTGGIGLRVFGSDLVGGKSYVWIFCAIAGFFALSSRPIPEHRAYLYIAMFFLPGLTSMIGRLVIWSGVGLDYVPLFFPLDAPPDALGIDKSEDLGAVRISGVVLASMSVFCWILARHGVAGVFDFSKPWRFLILAASLVLGMFGGFRSAIILCGLVFAILFCLERLWRTRVMGILVALVLIGGALVAGYADKLPLTVQRTLSFLPFNFDPLSKLSAETSTEWRLEMWRRVLPQVPQYFFKGKGYTISADELFLVREAEAFGAGTTVDISTYAGDYHNGLLSIIIPLGLYGTVAFFWLVMAGTRFLYRKYLESPPALRQVNAFLFALFLARILFYTFIYGSLASDLFHFLGILGVSVALNVRAKREPLAADELAAQEG
jgi:O-antigen ligase